jgi:carbamoyl-phosphate synthase small subunit
LIKKAKKISSHKISQIHTGVLVLEDKTIFKGIGIGYQGTATGEVCFNTSLTGYQEIISDPSYAGQIINFTFPHIGNVGVNEEDLESDKVWTKGVIFNSEITSNFNISKLANITSKWSGLKNLDLAEQVTTKKNYIWSGFKTWKKKTGYLKNKKHSLHVLAIDYGIKKNILRYFSDLNCKVTVVSCKTSAKNILKLKPNGIFLSNGPGDPAATGKYAIGIIKELIKNNLPVFGICLGHQILALTLGAKTKKMKLGHRGANHPVKNLIKNNVEITSQNHGFEIIRETLPKNIEVTHKSLFDNCIEGIRLKNKPIFSVQYHPESNPGPQDSVYLFQEFINNIKKNAKKKRS